MEEICKITNLIISVDIMDYSLQIDDSGLTCPWVDQNYIFILGYQHGKTS
jgi:hypothetical protein